MVRTDDQRETIAIDGDGSKMGGVRSIGNHSDFKGAQIQLLWNAARERAMNRDVHMGELAPKRVDGRQQIHTGVLIGRQLQLTTLQALQFPESACGLAT